jgi:hypothetical protein
MMSPAFFDSLPQDFQDMMAAVCGTEAAQVEWDIRRDGSFTVWVYMTDHKAAGVRFTGSDRKLYREFEYVMMSELCEFGGWDLVDLTYTCRFVFQHTERYAVRSAAMLADKSLPF